jgi:hypothetical protein
VLRGRTVAPSDRQLRDGFLIDGVADAYGSDRTTSIVTPATSGGRTAPLGAGQIGLACGTHGMLPVREAAPLRFDRPLLGPGPASKHAGARPSSRPDQRARLLQKAEIARRSAWQPAIRPGRCAVAKRVRVSACRRLPACSGCV